MGIERVLAALEAWIKTDPHWGRFQQGCGKGWDIRFKVMDADEAIDWQNKIIWLAMWRYPDPLFRTVHAMEHVDRHYGAERFTEAMCAKADMEAAFWVLVGADGDPMIAA